MWAGGLMRSSAIASIMLGLSKADPDFAKFGKVVGAGFKPSLDALKRLDQLNQIAAIYRRRAVHGDFG